MRIVRALSALPSAVAPTSWSGTAMSSRCGSSRVARFPQVSIPTAQTPANSVLPRPSSPALDATLKSVSKTNASSSRTTSAETGLAMSIRPLPAPGSLPLMAGLNLTRKTPAGSMSLSTPRLSQISSGRLVRSRRTRRAQLFPALLPLLQCRGHPVSSQAVRTSRLPLPARTSALQQRPQAEPLCT